MNALSSGYSYSEFPCILVILSISFTVIMCNGHGIKLFMFMIY